MAPTPACVPRALPLARVGPPVWILMSARAVPCVMVDGVPTQRVHSIATAHPAPGAAPTRLPVMILMSARSTGQPSAGHSAVRTLPALTTVWQSARRATESASMGTVGTLMNAGSMGHGCVGTSAVRTPPGPTGVWPAVSQDTRPQPLGTVQTWTSVAGTSPCAGPMLCAITCPAPSSAYVTRVMKVPGMATIAWVDVNECETLQGVCGAAPCENVEGSFLCICPGAAEEFDPMTGRCLRPQGAAARPPAFPRRPEASLPEPHPSGPGDSSRRECYYDPNAAQACENVLAWNTTRQECCCSLGHGWGLDCHIQECPPPGTAEFRMLCPRGSGFAAAGPGPATSALADVDECSLFSSQVCKGGVCVNKVPGYSCYCPSGYYYETQHLECIDNDECLDEEAEPCVGGHCINTIGSYYCSCAPPLVLDASQHRCVANDSQDANLAMCWQEVGPDLVCTHPRLDRQVTYTECCCLYGEAWSMDCALCPARDSEDFEALCNVLRPPSYGPVRPGGLGLPFEYGGGDFVPYGPEIFAPPARPAPRLPDYDPYPREPLYGPSPYEASDFEDLSYSEVRQEGLGEPPHGGYSARSPPEPEWHYPLRSSSSRGGGSYERPGRSSEGYRRSEDFGAAHSEECGILSGCENGHCVRVADGFTCLCHEGYRLDPTRMACLDIDECIEVEGLCPGGECFNTEGFYRCLCPHGMVPIGQPPRCVPAPRSQG